MLMGLSENYVLLVDDKDHIKEPCEKVKAHQEGYLHRAISIVILDGDKMLLQKRAYNKYHSGGLWSNAVCSHPTVDETIFHAARRALRHELGLEIPLDHLGSFIYREPVTNGLIEHEYDHIFKGVACASQSFSCNSAEVEAVKWSSLETIKQEYASEPHSFSAWFPHVWSFVFPKDTEGLCLSKRAVL